MNNTDLETFLTIVETKSITKAAEVLFLAPTTVGARLKSLEEEIGFPLIIRQKGHKNIALTEKGALFISYAEQWLGLWEEIHILKEKKSNLQFSIGSISSLATQLLSPFFTKFARENPSIDLKVQIMDTDIAYGLVQKRNIDVAFVLKKQSLKNVKVLPIISEPMVLVSSPDLSLPGVINDLSNLPYEHELHTNWGEAFLYWYQNQMDRVVFPRISVNTLPLLIDLFQKEGTWAIVPISVAKHLEKEKMARISNIKTPPPNRTGYMIMNKSPRKELNGMLVEFQHLLESYLLQGNISNNNA